ncbi:MAG: MBL fold metallo-hydrolase [Polyangiales bacterium]
MTITIQSIGAAQTVTGSRHLVRTKQSTLLLDCGLFQGHRRESLERNRELGFDAREVDAVVLSHAHIDHSGALPRLCKRGFRGPIYTTAATRDLCAAMLADAAMIQASDARYLNRAIERDHLDAEPIEPLFDQEDVGVALSQMIALPYRRRQQITRDAALSFLDAGHVLGSAICVLDLDDEAQSKRVVFTGDLGRRGSPILRDPELPDGANALITECTYGDRLHPPLSDLDEELAAVVARTVARGGKVVIPSFALERAQQLIYSLKKLFQSGKLAPIPVYVDSPLAVSITQVFRLHPECYDADAREVVQRGDSPFEFPSLHYTASPEDSRAIDRQQEPCIVIAASGMCEAGRVLHHLRATVEDPKNTVIIVGFQAQHTLGRRIVERRPRIRIFGVERALRAEVVVLNGFSAHADQSELLSFAEATRQRGQLRDVILVHGEPAAQDAMKQQLIKRGFASIHVPARSDLIRI